MYYVYANGKSCDYLTIFFSICASFISFFIKFSTFEDVFAYSLQRYFKVFDIENVFKAYVTHQYFTLYLMQSMLVT